MTHPAQTPAQPAESPPPAESRAPAQPPEESKFTRAWQRTLLPLMAGMLILLTAFFFVATILQLNDLQERVQDAPALDLGPTLQRLSDPAAASDEGLRRVTWETLARLEGHVLARRYHMANVLLMARVWARYLGFITGMILTLVGAAFVLGKLREQRTQLDAEGVFGKLGLGTSSPGLVLATLGTALMLATIVTTPKIDVHDQPLYTLPMGIGQTEAGGTTPAAVPPPQPFGGAADDDILKEMKDKIAPPSE